MKFRVAASLGLAALVITSCTSTPAQEAHSPKAQKELADAFNKALKTIRDNGTYAKLNAKYFPFDIY